MPQLIMRGVAKEDVKKLSTLLVDGLQEIVGCPRDYFTLEVMESTFIFDAAEVKGTPLIQVNWFDRGQEVQDKAARVIDTCLRQIGYEHVEIFFIPLRENNYYENGRHY